MNGKPLVPISMNSHFDDLIDGPKVSWEKDPEVAKTNRYEASNHMVTTALKADIPTLETTESVDLSQLPPPTPDSKRF
jgi:hypothetical protein